MAWYTVIVCPALNCCHLCSPALILRLVGLLLFSVAHPGSYFSFLVLCFWFLAYHTFLFVLSLEGTFFGNLHLGASTFPRQASCDRTIKKGTSRYLNNCSATGLMTYDPQPMPASQNPLSGHTWHLVGCSQPKVPSRRSGRFHHGASSSQSAIYCLPCL